MHLAEALALGLSGHSPADYPEQLTTRPTASARDGRLVTVALLTAAAAATARIYVRARRGK